MCRPCFARNHIVKLQANGKMDGSWRKRDKKYPPFKSLYNMFLNVNKHRKNIVRVDLTFDDFLGFTKIPTCYYCGEPVVWEPYRKLGKSNAYNLDRKNNKLGYTKDNCVVCCKGCNLLKSHFGVDEFLLRIGKISKNLKLC